jgi:hypothetical protein
MAAPVTVDGLRGQCRRLRPARRAPARVVMRSDRHRRPQPRLHPVRSQVADAPAPTGPGRAGSRARSAVPAGCFGRFVQQRPHRSLSVRQAAAVCAIRPAAGRWTSCRPSSAASAGGLCDQQQVRVPASEGGHPGPFGQQAHVVQPAYGHALWRRQGGRKLGRPAIQQNLDRVLRRVGHPALVFGDGQVVDKGHVRRERREDRSRGKRILSPSHSVEPMAVNLFGEAKVVAIGAQPALVRRGHWVGLATVASREADRLRHAREHQCQRPVPRDLVAGGQAAVRSLSSMSRRARGDAGLTECRPHSSRASASESGSRRCRCRTDRSDRVRTTSVAPVPTVPERQRKVRTASAARAQIDAYVDDLANDEGPSSQSCRSINDNSSRVMLSSPQGLPAVAGPRTWSARRVLRTRPAAARSSIASRRRTGRQVRWGRLHRAAAATELQPVVQRLDLCPRTGSAETSASPRVDAARRWRCAVQQRQQQCACRRDVWKPGAPGSPRPANAVRPIAAAACARASETSSLTAARGLRRSAWR